VALRLRGGIPYLDDHRGEVYECVASRGTWSATGNAVYIYLSLRSEETYAGIVDDMNMRELEAVQ
jgi:hypothetical protein